MYQGYDFLDIIEFIHIQKLSYKPKDQSIVHHTLNSVFLDFNYNCAGIPQNLLFEVGLPTDKEYADAVYKAIEQYYSGKISYQRVMEKFQVK